jgi:hypothetical protein
VLDANPVSYDSTAAITDYARPSKFRLTACYHHYLKKSHRLKNQTMKFGNYHGTLFNFHSEKNFSGQPGPTFVYVRGRFAAQETPRKRWIHSMLGQGTVTWFARNSFPATDAPGP